MSRSEYRSAYVANRNLEVTAEMREAAQEKFRRVMYAMPIQRIQKRAPSTMSRVLHALGVI